MDAHERLGVPGPRGPERGKVPEQAVVGGARGQGEVQPDLGNEVRRPGGPDELRGSGPGTRPSDRREPPGRPRPGGRRGARAGRRRRPGAGKVVSLGCPARCAEHLPELAGHDGRAGPIVRQAGGDEAHDADRPRPPHDGRRTARPRSPASAARASSSAVRVMSRRVSFDRSSAAAATSASAGVAASRSVAASAASPTLPAALSRGAMAKAMVSRVTAAGATPAAARSAAIPGRGVERSRSSPSRAIDRFSPRIGATSATVPMVARSARSAIVVRAGMPASRSSSSAATLRATPLPARRRSG